MKLKQTFVTATGTALICYIAFLSLGLSGSKLYSATLLVWLMYFIGQLRPWVRRLTALSVFWTIGAFLIDIPTPQKLAQKINTNINNSSLVPLSQNQSRDDLKTKLDELTKLKNDGTITEDDYKNAKEKLLNQFVTAANIDY